MDISKEHGGQKDTKARLGKTPCAFAKLQNIWKSNQYTTKTKIRLYNSNVKSILLSECWRVVKGDMADQCVLQWMFEKDLPYILAK